MTGKTFQKKLSPGITVIALGGSIIVPDKIRVGFLKKFREFILKEVKSGKRFIIVAGGGSTARNYIQAAADFDKVSDEDKDWLGIHATRINAHLLRTLFRKQAYSIVLDSPFKAVKEKKWKILIASGWRPGWSTDYDAVLLAERFKARKIIVASKIPYIYPRKKKSLEIDESRPIIEISWKDYKKLISSKWEPGMKAPVDPVAARTAAKLKMTLAVIRGTNLKNFKKALNGKDFQGTLVHP
jgi:uridylate kinase